jgi:amino acid permease
MKEIVKLGIIAGIAIFIMSYGSLFAGLYLIPNAFEGYISPVFNSDDSRIGLFYLHPFILSFALSFFWIKVKSMLKGNRVLKGLEFGLLYAIMALLPVMWITYSAVDVSFGMVLTWFLYGSMQASVAGIIFAYFDKATTN